MSLNLDSNTNKTWMEDTGSTYKGKPIVEAITNGFFSVDRNWKVKYWNRAAEKIMGVKREGIIGINIWEKLAAVIPMHFYKIYREAFFEEIPVHFEEYWPEMRSWFSVFIYIFSDTLSVSFKSSSQPRYQQHGAYELKMLNERYHFVTEITNDCLWELDFHTQEIFWVDGGHKRAFGYEIENTLIPQIFWENCIHPDDKIRVLSGLKKMITGAYGSIWEDEYRFKRSNGNYAYVHDRGHLIYDGSNACRMIGATQDISARKMNEIKLLESEKKLSLIARQTVNAVIITDAEEKITWVNSAFTRITEYQPEEVLGRKPGGFLQGKDTNPMTVQYLRKQMKDKLPFDCNIVNYSKSGRMYWMHIQGQPLLDEQGNCVQFFAIQTDITEKVLLETKLTEERLAKQNEITLAVLTAQENERQDIGKELHDNLNQILGAAKLYIEIAKTDNKNREVYLDKSSEYIVTVIEDIRRISRRLAIPGMHEIGLFENLKILFEELMVIHPVKIELYSEAVEEEDLDKKIQLNIFRIVQEQLNNIMTHAHAAHAVIHIIRAANEIILLISDDGRGCDMLTQSNGVGILNIKSRAELYHGMVTIVSKPGKGYQMKVVLKFDSQA